MWPQAGAVGAFISGACPVSEEDWGLGLFASWWALGWAWSGEALAPLRGDFPGVLGAPAGLIRRADAPDGVGAVEVGR